MAVVQHSITQGSASQFFYRAAPGLWKRYWATRMMAISLTTHMERQGGPRGALMTLLVRKGLQYGWFLNGRTLPVGVQVQDYKDMELETALNTGGGPAEASFNLNFDATLPVEVRRICDGLLALVKEAINAGAENLDRKVLLVDSDEACGLYIDMSIILSSPEKGVDQVGTNVWSVVSKAFVLCTTVIGQNIPTSKPNCKLSIDKEKSMAAMTSIFILYLTVSEMLKLQAESESMPGA